MFIPIEHFVKIGSINTCYWAEGEGTPVVLVHGMGGSAAGWLPSIEALAAEHRVYAPDLIGHGRTDKPASVVSGFPDLIRFVHDFMTELKIERAHIVGHSMGGVIALHLAIDFPTCVDKLVLVDASGLGKEVSFLFRMLSIPFVGEYLASRAYTPDVKKYGSDVRAGSKNPANITDELVETLYRIEQTPTQYKTTLSILRMGVNWMGQKKSFYGPNLQQLPSITHPTLVIWGLQDDVLPPKHGELAVKKIKNGQLKMIDQCGHVPMFDQPEVFNKSVLDFLRD